MPPTTGTVSPAVLTSSAADQHINDVVKPELASVTAGMQNQAAQATTPSSTPTPTTSATTQAPGTSTNASSAPLSSYSYISTDGSSKTVQAVTPNEAMTKAGDIAAHSGVQQVPTPPGQTAAPQSTSTTDTTTLATPTDPYATQNETVSDAQKQLDTANAEYQTQSKSVSDTIKNIQTGVIPLNAGEQAQVAGLQAQFQSLIQTQSQTNTSATGLANIRGYQTGSAEYDPTFQVKTIGAIVTAGNNKIADLNVKMASAVASLIQSFKSDDIAAVKDAWDVYQDASTKRTTALQKTIDDTTKAIQDAQAAQQKQVDAVNTVTEELAKNGAPADIIAAATKSGTVAGAIAAGAGYFQDPTSTGGQYSAYVKDAQSKGLTPMTPADFLSQQKAKDAYNAAYASESVKAQFAGGDAEQQKLFNQGVSTLKSELSNRSGGLGLQDAKVNQARHLKSMFDQYKVTKEVPNVGSAGQTLPGTHTEVVYNIPRSQYTELAMGLASLISPSNTVAEGTINKITQATAKGSLNQAITYATGQPQNGTTQAVLQNLKDSVDRQGSVAEDLRATYVNDLLERLPPGLSQENTESLAKSAQLNSYLTPKEKVDSYVTSNPDRADAVAKLYEVPGVTDQDVADYLNQGQ